MSFAPASASASSLLSSSSLNARIPDLVRDTCLETSFVGDSTIHLHDDSSDDDASGATNSRPTRRAEYWTWGKRLGKGGCGDVWLQRCVQGKRRYESRAVKVIDLDGGGGGGSGRKGQINYIRELEAIAKFSQKRYSKWFVKLLGWYDDGTKLFIAMEYFPLGDLQSHISEHGPMDEADVREVVYQVLEGLHCMHREGFAHRDVKPANVLIKTYPPDRWWVKISDFGISKRIGESTEEYSTFKGTFAYMAPELLHYTPGNAYQINYRAADMWSLGEMVFRMLTNSATFPTPGAYLQYLAKPDLFPSQELAKHNSSEDVDGFIRSLMRPMPEDRLASDKALDHKWILPCKASTPALAPFPVPTITTPRQLKVTAAVDQWATRSSTAASTASHSPATVTPRTRGFNRYSQAAAEEPAKETARQERPSSAGDMVRQSLSPGPSSQPTSPSTPEFRLTERFLRRFPVLHQPAVNLFSTSWNPCLQTLEGHTDLVWSITYLPDGARLASASDDKSIKIWYLATGHCLQTLEGHTYSVFSVASSPNSTRLASASGDGSIKIWDLETGRCVQTLEGHSDSVFSVAYSPNGTCLASASGDGSTKIWDIETGRCVQTLKGHTGVVFSVAYSPDGARLASASGDGSIKIWDLATSRCLRTLKGQLNSQLKGQLNSQFKGRLKGRGHTDWVYSVAYSPDGAHLASASDDKNIKIWDLETGLCLLTLKGHTYSVRSVTYSPDGARLASASFDKSISIWDLATGHCLRTLEGHTDPVSSVAYSPDGTRLASASVDKSIKIWDIRESFRIK